MRLTDEMIVQDDARFRRKDMLAEFEYCGTEIPNRKSITSDVIRFYAFLCRAAFHLLKEQEAKEVIRCEDCKNWIPGTITDDDDFIPPKCGKYQQMVGHYSDDYCSLAERR